MTAGQSLFSLFPPAFAAVPQYCVHITVVLLSLTEPDKRISHTSGSSVHYSVSLRFTKRVQVFADLGLGPLHPVQYLVEARPGVCPALTLAVEPFKQDMFCAIDIVGTPFRVIRYGVVAQVSDYTDPGLSEHLAFSQHMSRCLGPVCELAQAMAKFLATAAALHLKMAISAFATVVGKSQIGKVLQTSKSITGTLVLYPIIV